MDFPYFICIAVDKVPEINVVEIIRPEYPAYDNHLYKPLVSVCVFFFFRY